MTQTRKGRRGVTLIEMLVVMAIITALGLLALMLLPGINNSDAALKATEEVRATCKVAQALAGGSRQPRGVRFLGPALNAPLGQRYATEMQLLESPPIVILDPLALVATTNNPTGVDGARVELVYELYSGTESSIDPLQPGVTPPRGAIKFRRCQVFKLTQDQRDQVKDGAMLVLPAMGAWSRIKDPITQIGTVTTNGIQTFDLEITLDFYPDTFMGASTAYRTYLAGIYGPPVPLLGQPTIPLPTKTAVDLDISSPALPTAGPLPDYDIMFAPDGQTISVMGRSSNAGIYLWVRDITKVTNPTGTVPTSMVPSQFPGGQGAAWADGFRRGGEQHAVGISNGFVGTAPIQWPDVNGQFPGGSDPFTFARKRLQ